MSEVVVYVLGVRTSTNGVVDIPRTEGFRIGGKFYVRTELGLHVQEESKVVIETRCIYVSPVLFRKSR